MLRSLLGLSVVFCILSLIAALFGFGMDSTELWGLAKILFWFSAILVEAHFLGHPNRCKTRRRKFLKLSIPKARQRIVRMP